ncbi:TonB-dependent receptor plug domain-containing protein [Geothermobacter hydrogeniphilus]|uniref:Iron complex outermembrane recepter protein n=1 Tax=Geothermobacter hydrogeniphilus TaxID=1969733 RepID=A0A1X0Y3W1_9BACT|nr:TonB-dependent receptor [Geothermobacter hydrogeniphilus]ORJ59833.1 hypothetical protein B5V00_09165 [Geothermobacter hydrogeniphilus]
MTDCRPPRRRHRILLFCMLLAALADIPARAADPPDLTSLNLEELLNVEVTSAARRPQGIYDTAAAIYVISQEDIRRSGATSLPEILRMVPGIQVARINSSVWAVSARGLNDRFANKLLVMQDGRTLYNRIFSGVYWDAQDTVLEDIERIEVIRGPGAAIWGANAVNGVINIITKSAAATRGSLLSLTLGNEDRVIVEARQGVALNENADLRVYAKGFERASGSDAGGNDNSDDWRTLRGGFRFDREQAGRRHLTLQGDIYRGSVGETFTLATLAPPFSTSLTDDTDIFGGNLLGRWKEIFSATSDLSLQVFYDKARNWDIASGQDQQTFDIDFQHRFAPTERQLVGWGLGYRHIWDRTKKGPVISFTPQDEKNDLFTAFINDQIELIPDHLRLIAGTQIEHNDYSGFEIQPTLRLLWTPRPFYTIWGAISRSVRTPSRAETGIDLRQNVVPVTLLPPPLNGLPAPALGQFSLIGNDNFDSTTAWTYELGLRCQPAAATYLELVLFHTSYEGLASVDLGTPVNEGANWLLPMVGNNRLDADSYGIELAADWMPRRWWKLQSSYTYLNVTQSLQAGAVFTGFKQRADNSPHHQLSLRSSIDFARNWEWDAGLRLVDNLPGSNVSGYLGIDARLAWKPRPGWQLELVGQNLNDPHHPEFVSEVLNTTAIEVDRSLFLRGTWIF